MTKENAILDKNQNFTEDLHDFFDFDELEEKLQNQLEEELADLEFLKEEKMKIGSIDNLGDVIKDVIWEQFINQMAITAGDDFIKENNNLTLNLRNEAHIQTTENFKNNKIATHNTKIDYQERYDTWQNNFQKNEDGTIRTKLDYRTQEERAVLRVKNNKKDPQGENYNTNYDARQFIDKGRPKGSKTVHKDHTISAAEIIRDPEVAAHMTREEQASFANSDVNLIDLDSAANSSKGDSRMNEWLNSERKGKGAGKSQAEYFGLDEEELLARDNVAREEYEKQKKEAEKKSIQAGKQSQREEAFRIGGKALRAVVMQLLAELVKEIIRKLVNWFKYSKKGLDTLLDSLKEAIHSFISKLKIHLINSGNALFDTVAQAIIGPIFGTIKKVCMMLKQGWKSLKDAINYIRSPQNKGKPIGRLLLETGKIIIVGLVGTGAIALSEVIEKGLLAIPIFAIEIPLIGKLANILGVFFSAVVAGIIGAIAMNIIEKKIEKKLKKDNIKLQVNSGNEVLNIQHQVRIVSEAKLENDKAIIQKNIKERHSEAVNIMNECLQNIMENCEEDESIQNTFDDIDNLLDELELD